MHRFPLTRVAFLAALSFVFAAAASADVKTPSTTGLPKIQMTHQDFKHNTRTAIAHKAIEMHDPKTGKAVKAEDFITLPDGKKVKAGPYFAELNKLEQKFNAIGYSLRDKAGKKIVLHDAIVPHDTMNTQIAAHKKAHLAFNAQTMRAVPTIGSLQQRHSTALASDAARVKAVSAALPKATKTSDYVKTWKTQLGKPSLIAAFLEGKLEFHGSSERMKLQADASAGGYLMNHRMVLLQAKGAIDTPAKGNSRATLNVYIKGQSVFNVDKSVNTTWTLSKSLNQSFDYGTSFHFSIGPIPVSGRIGVRGSAGVNFLLGIRPAHATAHIIPHIDAKVYAQAGVDVGIASAGVGGQLTLLKDTLDLGAEVGLDFDSQKGPYITEHLYLRNRLEMLSGNFYLYARVNYLIGSHEWHMNLWNWKGYHVDGYLFNVNNRVYLDPSYQPVAAASKTSK